MTLVTDLLTNLGYITLEQIGFPLVIWTIISAPITIFLHYSDSIPPTYQYHSRVGLLLTLPFGIATSHLLEMMNNGTPQQSFWSSPLLLPFLPQPRIHPLSPTSTILSSG